MAEAKIVRSQVNLTTVEGRIRFNSSLSGGNAECFFALVQYFEGQAKDCGCGIASIVTVVNALGIRPPNGRSIDGFHRFSQDTIELPSLDRKTVENSEGIWANQMPAILEQAGAKVEMRNAKEKSLEDFERDVLRVCQSKQGRFMIIGYMRNPLNLDPAPLEENADHWSLIGAYDAISKSVLILDTNFYKYEFHWIGIEALFEACRVSIMADSWFVVESK